MAKNNKFTAINFNHIYDKTTSSNHQTPKTAAPSSLPSSSPSFSASYSSVSAPNKPHGRILVLTRPTPKPITPPTQLPSKQPQPTPIQTVPDQPPSDAISLRPQGRTGSGPVLSGPNLKDRAVHVESPPPLISPKPDKFVPPHLRPGYVPKVEEVPPGPEMGRGRDLNYRRGAHVGSPGKYGEDGRPKSGGYERIRRAGGSDAGLMGRPRSSSGSRPSSSGWYILQFLCNVDEKFVPKVGMTFNTLEDTAKFYKDYLKIAGFSTKVRSTNKKDNEIKNQLITCSREEKWKSKIFPTKKTNPSTGLNYPARIYIHILKNIGVCIILKVVLHHSHPCCPNQAEMLKQHRKLSMSVRRIIENNEEAGIRPSKTYQSFVAIAGGYHELNFIEKDVRNYITREVRNVSELEDAKEFEKYLLRMK